jgi:hypothetical protein
VNGPGAEVPAGPAARAPDYCREVEAYLCRKNDGHLIRVVGPAFDRVSRWAAEGIPLKVAFRGIDRCFERYYRTPSRRRPVRIEFCEADVLDVFDEWRRAVGLPSSAVAGGEETRAGETPDGEMPAGEPRPRRSSLADHLERALQRLTSARALGALGPEAEDLIDRVSRELDAARAPAGGLRGEPRRALIARLTTLDEELGRLARHRLSDGERGAVLADAEQELASFRAAMPDAAFRRACHAAADRLIRDRLGLPTLAFL